MISIERWFISSHRYTPRVALWLYIYILYTSIYTYTCSFNVPIPIAALQHETGQCLMLCHRGLLSSPLWVTAEEHLTHFTNSFSSDRWESGDLGRFGRYESRKHNWYQRNCGRGVLVWSEKIAVDNSNIKGVSNGVHGQIISNFPTRHHKTLMTPLLGCHSANGKRDNSEEINILDAVNSTEKNRHSNPNNWQCKI